MAGKKSPCSSLLWKSVIKVPALHRRKKTNEPLLSLPVRGAIKSGGTSRMAGRDLWLFRAYILFTLMGPSSRTHLSLPADRADPVFGQVLNRTPGPIPSDGHRRVVMRTLYTEYPFLRDSFAALAAGGENDRRYRAFYPEISVTTNSFTQSIHVSPMAGPMPTLRPLLDHDHPARPVRNLSIEQLGLITPQPRPFPSWYRKYRRTPIPLSCISEGTHVDGTAASTSSDRSETCSTFQTSTEPTIRSPTAPTSRRWAGRGRWRNSPHNASTIRCIGCRTTRRPAQVTFRISCCSPTTSSISTNSAPTPET